MRTCLLTAAALLLAAGAGCNSMNFARRGEDAGGLGAAAAGTGVAQAVATGEQGGVAHASHQTADGEASQIMQVGHHGPACAAPSCAAPGCTTAAPSCAADPSCGCGSHGGCGHNPFAIRGGLLYGCRGGLLDHQFKHGCGVLGCGRHGCGPGGCGVLGHGGMGHGGMGHMGHGGMLGTPGYPYAHHREYAGPQGPPTGQVAYPYYTTRGPRDFLLDNPPSIGR